MAGDDVTTDSVPPRGRVLLAKPRGYCAGVDRAVQTVEHALEHYGAPVYVRKQIVHNLHVVEALEARGAIFVEENDEVPEGSIVVFSAHGVAPEVHEQAAAPQPAHDRRDLPAGDQGAPRGAPVREGRLRHPADRTRGPRGGRRHQRRGARAHHARRRPGRRRERRGPRPGEGRLALADDAVGGRDDADRRRAARAVPAAAVPAVGRHLLRDAEPAGRGEDDRARRSSCSSSSGRRNSSNSVRMVEVAAAAGARDGVPGRERRRDRRGVAGRRDVDRAVVRRVGARHPRPGRRSTGSPRAGTATSRRSATPRSG